MHAFYSYWLLVKNLAKFARKHLQYSPIFSKFLKCKTPLLVCSCEFCETFTTALLKSTSGRFLLKYQIGLILPLSIVISLISGVNVMNS